MDNKLEHFKRFIGKNNLRILIILSILISVLISVIIAFIHDSEGYKAFNYILGVNFLIIFALIWFSIIICFLVYFHKLKIFRLKVWLFTAKDDKIRLAKSIFIGAVFSLFIAYLTSDNTYITTTNGNNLAIGLNQFNKLSENEDYAWTRIREFKDIIIVMSFLFGASLSYTLIEKLNK